jgi:hypothetical membrane protein
MKRRSISLVSAMFVVLCYVSLALFSFTRYPSSYSPLCNWLSDLGSIDLNPTGARFYNTGILLTGLFLLPFFLGLVALRIEGNKKQHIMLWLTQVFGILGALSLLMSGVFPIDFTEVHQFWSILLYITLGTSFIFSVAALRYHRQCPRWVLLLGVVAALVDILSGIFHTTYILEWFTVGLFLCYLCVLGDETRRLSRDSLPSPSAMNTRIP